MCSVPLENLFKLGRTLMRPASQPRDTVLKCPGIVHNLPHPRPQIIDLVLQRPDLWLLIIPIAASVSSGKTPPCEYKKTPHGV